MELPKDDEVLSLTLYPNGSVCLYLKEVSKAIELSPHGRLVDVDFIKSCMEEIKENYPNVYELIVGILDRTPTVLEASTEGR